MRKERIHVPRPKSSFLLVKCSKCGNEETVFSAASRNVACKACGELLAEKAGGRAKILGVVLRRLD